MLRPLSSLSLFRFFSAALFFIFCSSFRVQSSSAQAPAPPPAASETAPPAEAPPPPQPVPGKTETASSPSSQVPGVNSELSSQDTPPTFRVRVNLVLARVVVRDAQGKIVRDLKKEDFQLLDNRKPQTITYFAAESPDSSKPAPSGTEKHEPVSEAIIGDTLEPATPAIKLPQRFVALLFDDVHLTMEDATFVRDAATRFFGALAATDRVGIFTSSGQFKLAYTSDHEALQRALLSIVPHPVTSGSGFHDCPDVPYYQADLIVNRTDPQALAVATEDAVQCAFNGDETKVAEAAVLASVAARRALSSGDEETEYAYRHLEEVMRGLAVMPGQRIMVLVSPGFIPSTLWPDLSALVDRANRASVVINTIDARGLYTPDLMGDIANPPHDSNRTRGFKASYRIASQQAQSQVLDEMARGTGGTFFHNRNDVDEGLRLAGAAPELSYVLGFSPQNLKADGHFHTLKVTLTNKQKFSIQARNGYYAPRTVSDPAENAKREIQEAIFSQEEMHDVPVDLQTQFFKKDATSARLSVLTHFDLKGIHFRKAEGRNKDNLTIATAIFDENGNFVTGGEKLVQMKLLDTTYDRLSRSGITLKSSYDVKPGSYLVRLVVRDAEGAQMAARNGAVVIPN